MVTPVEETIATVRRPTVEEEEVPAEVIFYIDNDTACTVLTATVEHSGTGAGDWHTLTTLSLATSAVVWRDPVGMRLRVAIDTETSCTDIDIVGEFVHRSGK